MTNIFDEVKIKFMSEFKKCASFLTKTHIIMTDTILDSV